MVDSKTKMTIEIDQSGKIEETNRDTVVAFSNGKSYSIKISGKTKRKLQEIFRRIGEPRTFVIHTFCVLIFLAIKKYTTENDQVISDLFDYCPLRCHSRESGNPG